MSYPSDLKEEEWKLIEGYFKPGNQSIHEKKELVNAVFYLVKTGCQWRQLPKDFPHWKTVYSFFRRAKLKGVWEAIMMKLVKKSRNRYGKLEMPTYSIIDSQSVKTINNSDERGFDGGKKNQRP